MFIIKVLAKSLIENNMENKCFNCSNLIPDNDKIYYCPFCLIQVKCKKCSETLMKGALGCTSCGTLCETINPKSSELNQIEFEQKGDSKKFKAIFTNEVGHELVATFGGMIGIPIPKKKLFGINTVGAGKTLEINANNSIETIDIETIEDDDITEALAKIFKVDGDSLIFQTSNFKSSNRLKKEIRIALLVLLGYKYIHNAEEIKRQLLTDMLNKFKLNSSGFRSWINKSEEIGQKGGNIIFLTPNGLTTALEVLSEVVNPSITEGSVAFAKTSSSSKRKTSNDSGSESRKSAKGSKQYILNLIDANYFSEKRSLNDIVNYIKDNYAQTFKTTDISGHMGKLLGKNGLRRVKGESGNYEYFI